MKIKPHLEKLSKLIANYNFVPTEDLFKDTYKMVLVAILTKSLDFNLFLYRNRSPKNSFFYSPFLRGLCEDLITIKFVKKHFKSDTDEVLMEYLTYLLYSSVNAQMAFFKANAPLQRSVGYKNINQRILEKETRLKSLMERNGLNKNRLFPSVEHMAIDSKLKPLYDFLYHATSRMVHFSPNVLLRMGWYENDGPTIFSSHNFYRYYESFNKFYAPYLLIQLCDSFKKDLGLGADFMKQVKSIKSMYNNYVFYPELITYEELNLERPKDNILTQLLRNMAAQPKGKQLLDSIHNHEKPKIKSSSTH